MLFLFPFLRPSIYTMSKLKLFLNHVRNIILGVVLSIVVFCGLYLLWSSFLSEIDKNLAAGIIAGGTTVIVSIASVLMAKHAEQQSLIKNEHRKRKAPIYTELIKFLFKIMSEAQEKKEPNQNEISKFMTEFTQKLLIWGSDDVILAFNEFKRPPHDSKSVMCKIENIFFMIRKDLGHENKGIAQGMLLNLFIADIDKFLRDNTSHT